MAAPGDRVIVTKDAARSRPPRSRRTAVPAPARWHAPRARTASARAPEARPGERGRRLPRRRCAWACAIAASSTLHDATEGGVLGGLIELARACGPRPPHRAREDSAVAEARAACEDVAASIRTGALSEGTLIVAARPAHANAVITALDGRGDRGRGRRRGGPRPRDDVAHRARRGDPEAGRGRSPIRTGMRTAGRSPKGGIQCRGPG